MTTDLFFAESLEQALGSAVGGCNPVAGGDINQAYSVELKDKRTLFVKANPRAPRGMFSAEAEGLRFLAEANSPLIVPEVLYVGENFLVLEQLAETRKSAPEALGQGLAALHAAPHEGFGGLPDNFIGTLHPVQWCTRNLE